MLARNLPLASALTLVALGLFANAGVNLVTSTQGTAFADDGRSDGSSGSVPSKVPSRLVGEWIRVADGGAALAAMSAGGCVEGEPLAWLGEIRELPYCWQLGTTSLVATDVDRDGNQESFTYSSFIIQGDKPVTGDCCLGVFSAHEIRQSLVQERRCLLDSERIANWVLERTRSALNVNAYFSWMDMDSDGDPDLVVQFFGTYSYGEGDGTLRAWIENVAAQPLTGDLNQDGSVNATDLTMLLGGWTGN